MFLPLFGIARLHGFEPKTEMRIRGPKPMRGIRSRTPDKNMRDSFSTNRINFLSTLIKLAKLLHDSERTAYPKLHLCFEFNGRTFFFKFNTYLLIL